MACDYHMTFQDAILIRKTVFSIASIQYSEDEVLQLFWRFVS